MKITATPLTVGSPPIILGDDSAGDYIDGLLPKQDRNVQEVELFRAEFSVFYSRKNKKNRFEFTVARDHGDRDTAFTFLLDHPGLVPDSCDVKFEHGGKVRYLRSAQVHGPECIKHNGQATVFKYQISGGALSTK